MLYIFSFYKDGFPANVFLSIPPAQTFPALHWRGLVWDAGRLCWQWARGGCVLMHFLGISASLASALICLGMPLPIQHYTKIEHILLFSTGCHFLIAIEAALQRVSVSFFPPLNTKFFSLEISLMNQRSLYHFLGIRAKSWWLRCCSDQFLRLLCN